MEEGTGTIRGLTYERLPRGPGRLSITHNFCSDHGAQRDIGEA